MDDPDSIEVDEKMNKRPFFVEGLEEHPIPINPIEFHETLRRRNIDETFLGREIRHILNQE